MAGPTARGRELQNITPKLLSRIAHDRWTSMYREIREVISIALLSVILAAGCLSTPAAPCEVVIEDDFEGPLDTGVWTFANTSGCVSTEETGRQLWAEATEDSTCFARIRALQASPLEGLRYEARVEVDGDGEAGIRLRDDNQFFTLMHLAGDLRALRREGTASAETVCDLECPPYDPDLHAYFRLREDGGELFFEASPDRADWSHIGAIDLGAVEEVQAEAVVFAVYPEVAGLVVHSARVSQCQ
jgi:hypothetical protein